ncbi:rod shape-determining protein MreC [Psychrobium sp. 1_MG-2023]|uniref:rod shape-determining protein MreC n=1 Tax=Psychrobium sp. 1_MG-2023 TaxID=3062624 RepID=UPI000C31BC14|nr:rod shape-determining protein MreC [Psychrobium sp. 1_MG-2023]MDP2560720.1 rod shape-determining protein MreC [Psychrobium sp. 1_MG-2023]PKF56612.1 rod shape-determining protein MreC [Alteromonadales bacterium alter-6D02]
MKTIFSRRFPTSIRLLIFIIISSVLILSTERMTPYRVYLTTLLSPLQYLANAPIEALDVVSSNVKSRSTLIAENEQLRRHELLVADRLLKLKHLEQENKRLRALLGSPVQPTQRKLIARVQAVDTDPFRLHVMINKGSVDGVFIGQPVVDEDGVVGQVVEVSQFNSRILLIADNSHAIPLRNQRNDVRLIGEGTGDLHQLELQFVTKSTDIKIGDLLVTSGLGGVFPEGYPVARVSGIANRGSEIYSTIQVEPIAQLDRVRYLLLLWPNQPTVEVSNASDDASASHTIKEQ